MIIRELISAKEIVSGYAYRPTVAGMQLSADKVAPLVSSAMREYLKPILSIEFYDDLVTSRNEGDCNYNPDYTIVPAFITPFDSYEELWQRYLYEICANAAIIKALPHFSVQIGDIGLFQAADHNTVNADIDKAKYLLEVFKQNVSVATTEMIIFLSRNPQAYPLFAQYSPKYIKPQALPDPTKPVNPGKVLAGIVFNKDSGLRY